MFPFFFKPGRRARDVQVTLVIEVRLSGELSHPQATYTLTSSNFPVPPGVVSANGDINLRALPPSVPGHRTVISYVLAGTLLCNGGQHSAIFQAPPTTAFGIRRISALRRRRLLRFFVYPFYPSFPSSDHKQLDVVDENDDGAVYKYSLLLEVPECGNRRGTLDPSITNR